MYKKAKILIFCTIIVAGGVFAQNQGNKYAFIPLKTKIIPSVKTAPPVIFYARQGAMMVLPQNFYVQQFGFFCKKEWQLEKAVKIPFKFRLGSLQQCDWLEGKPNTGIR